MKVTVGQLRRIIRENLEGTGQDFRSIMDEVLYDLYDVNKKIEKAHRLAPQGTAKAIIAGMYSDLFNKIAEFRKYIEKFSDSGLGRSKSLGKTS